MYPEANIWLIGHSLGGAVAALIGATFGAPTVSIEAPGERMAARRLHLPSPVSLLVLLESFRNLTVHNSPPLYTSLMCTIQLTQYLWVHVPVLHLFVVLAAML